mgnify:CR=1 FL=1
MTIEASDTASGPYFLGCASDQTVTFDLGLTINPSTTIKFSFRPHSNSSNSIETLFSFYSGSGTWQFAVEYIRSNNNLQIRQGTASTVITAANSITPGNVYF